MSGRLEGKVCVITGTGGSMGRAAALLFTREGAMVVGCDISETNGLAALKEVNAAGGKMVSLQPCDLTKPEQCQAVVDLAIKTFGRIDVLYNNAAKAYFNWIEDVSDEEIVAGIKLLAETEGIFTETAGGVTVAVTRKLIEQGRIKPDDLTVIAITGNGLKTPEAVELARPVVIEPKVAQFERAISGLAARA